MSVRRISHHTRVFVRAREWVCSDSWAYSREVRSVKLYDSVARERENALTAAGSDRYLPIWFFTSRDSRSIPGLRKPDSEN
jgi:hypothetical protein